MQNKLEAMEGHEKMNKEKNPIKSLSVIEGVSHNFCGQSVQWQACGMHRDNFVIAFKKRMMNNFVNV